MALTTGNPGEFDINYDEWAEMSEEEQAQARDQAIAQTMLGDVGAFASMGSVAGPWGALIGAIAGTIVGIVDADASRKAMEVELAEREDQREELQNRLDEAMDYRANIVRHAEALLHPVEQSFRTRARAFGAQAAVQGLTGAQAVSAQLQAESFYREKVGPNLPAVMVAAEQEGQRRAMLRIQAIESEHKIDLSQQAQDLQGDMAAASAKAQAIKGVTSGLSSIAMSTAVGMEDLLENQTLGTSQHAMTSAPGTKFATVDQFELYGAPFTESAEAPGFQGNPDPTEYIKQYQGWQQGGQESAFEYDWSSDPGGGLIEPRSK